MITRECDVLFKSTATSLTFPENRVTYAVFQLQHRAVHLPNEINGEHEIVLLAVRQNRIYLMHNRLNSLNRYLFNKRKAC